MRPSSSTSEPAPGAAPGSAPGAPGSLFGPLFGAPAVDRELADAARLQALLDVEAALARAAARAGAIPAEAAAAITACCAVEHFDAADLGRRSLAAGNPVVPLVRDLGALVGPQAAPYVHPGATSQDVLDTATSLVLRRALAPLLDDLAGAAEAAAGLARAHRTTVLPGRTLLQQALPTTFGLKAAGWLVALDDARAALADLAEHRLAAQLGGAAGTLAALGEHGLEVHHAFAAELGLPEPVLPWHSDRTRLGALAGALGVAAGVLGKIALDVKLLAQTEVAEVAEGGGPGRSARGGSSTMPHKRNPVGAVLVTAGAVRVPGLVATLLAAMAQEHERAAGAWHAEWEPLAELVRVVGGAAGHARTLLADLHVDADRMRADVDAAGGLTLAESVTTRLAPRLGRAQAHDLVRRLAGVAATDGAALRDVLLADPTVREHLDEAAVDAALDPAGYLGSATAFVDRALAAHAADAAGRAFTPGAP